MTRNTGQIIGKCEYTDQPRRKPTTSDLAREMERLAVIKRKKMLADADRTGKFRES